MQIGEIHSIGQITSVSELLKTLKRVNAPMHANIGSGTGSMFVSWWREETPFERQDRINREAVAFLNREGTATDG